MEEKQLRSMQLFRLMDRMRRAWTVFTPKPEISKSQFGTLLALRHGGKRPCEDKECRNRDPFEPMTLSELAKIMNQSMPALSQRISKLEGMVYVQRMSDQKDRRTTWIRLTPTGSQLLDSSFQNLVSKMNFIMEQLGEEDTRLTFRVLEQLAQILEGMSDEQEDTF